VNILLPSTGSQQGPIRATRTKDNEAERGLTILLVTHEHDIATYASRLVAFRDGCVRRDEPIANPRKASSDRAGLAADAEMEPAIARKVSMSLLMVCVVAIRALRRNAMRTSLTALGMIIGVAAVIVMIALGSGARASIETQIRNAGSNLVIVTAASGSFGPVRQGQGATTTLTPADADAIRAEIDGIRYLSPGVNLRTQAVSESSNWATQIQGAGEEFSSLRSWPLQFGSFFTQQDVVQAAKVAVVGSVVRDQLFGADTDPTGATIRIRNQPSPSSPNNHPEEAPPSPREQSATPIDIGKVTPTRYGPA
jgi:macrolide transport system ATP-binding/permease protein